MNRRHFLIQLSAIGLSGCSAIGTPSTSYAIENFRLLNSGDDVLSCDIDVIDAMIDDESDAILQFTVKNELDQEIYIESDPNPPFGILWAAPVSSESLDQRILLWQEDMDGVKVHEDGSISMIAISRWTPLPPRSSKSEPFQIRFDDPRLTEGTFRISEYQEYSLDYEQGMTPDGFAEYTVEFDITVKQFETAAHQ